MGKLDGKLAIITGGAKVCAEVAQRAKSNTVAFEEPPKIEKRAKGPRIYGKKLCLRRFLRTVLKSLRPSESIFMERTKQYSTSA